MVQQPEALNKHYYDLFVKILMAKIPEYDKCEKDLISDLGTVNIQAFDPTGSLFMGMGTVGEKIEHIRFRGTLSVERADLEVEAVVRLLAENLATWVETLIGQTGLKGTPVCYDLLKLSDGSPNLETFYCVKGNEPTVDDMTGSITGWFAYKLRFTVIAKAQSPSASR